MASVGAAAARSFRQKFTLPNVDVLRWFPGHMYRSMNKIIAKLKDIDCIVEVHDSRIPFSGRNPNFRDLISMRPHALILNKCDRALYDEDTKSKVVNKLRSEGVDLVFFTNLLDSSGNYKLLRNKILPELIQFIESRPRYSRENLPEYNALVIGVPNVGKSTFINASRWAHIRLKGKATPTGANAGITKNVLSKIRVNSDPPTYIIDTPGILTPKVPNLETGMRLAACACIPDHLVGEENIADYLLYWFNKRQKFEYVDLFGLREPTDNVLEFLSQVAIRDGLLHRVLIPSTNQYVFKPAFGQAASVVLKSFRDGCFGRVLLDDDRI